MMLLRLLAAWEILKVYCVTRIKDVGLCPEDIVSL